MDVHPVGRTNLHLKISVQIWVFIFCVYTQFVGVFIVREYYTNENDILSFVFLKHRKEKTEKKKVNTYVLFENAQVQ